MITLSGDPVVSVHWSADGVWLACALATDGGVRTQVWVVRPDGRDARLIAGGPQQHAELGPWTRSGHRFVVTIPGLELTEPSVAYLADPATGDLTPLAIGELISVLDLSVDEDYVIVKDGQRGKQFCVVVDRIADRDHPLLPYPALGSTDRAMIRPTPAARAWSPTWPATRPCPGGNSWPFRWAPRAGAVRPGCCRRGRTPSWRGWTPTTPASC